MQLSSSSLLLKSVQLRIINILISIKPWSWGLKGGKKVVDLARTLELDLIFDIFGDVSLKMAEDLGASAIKLHPTDFTNFDLIKRVTASSVKNVIAGLWDVPSWRFETHWRSLRIISLSLCYMVFKLQSNIYAR